jgi:hypothetical protein
VQVISRLATGLFAIVVILCLLLCYRYADTQSAVTMVIFNLFFISLFFLLRGSMLLKALMLAAGNLFGLLWNLTFYYVSAGAVADFGGSCNILLSLIYPFLNLMWVVPFWSLSLSFLPSFSTDGKLEAQA